MKRKCHWYIEINRYGLEFTYDSKGWAVRVFSSKRERQRWLDRYEYDGQKYIARACTRDVALRIGLPDMFVQYGSVDDLPGRW